MNEFAAFGIVLMLTAMWLGKDAQYPVNGFAVGLFLAGGVLLILNLYLADWYSDWLWRRRGWLSKRKDKGE